MKFQHQLLDGCSGLKSIDKILKNANKIGESAFAGCDGLQNITIPNNIIEIGNSVFNRM